MLPHRSRLTKTYEIQKTVRFGKRVEEVDFSARFLKVEEPFSRFAFIASKKIGNAVSRHRTLRLLREVIRQQSSLTSKSGSYWVVFIAKRDLSELKLIQVDKEMQLFLRKIASPENK